ncbi:MAG: tetratricopeptide repeat protein [Chthoniobacterales bacterium]
MVHTRKGTSVAPSHDRWKLAAICVVLAAITWIVFGQTLGYPFINLDDSEYVVRNPNVSGGVTWAGVTWAFTHVHASNWHPLTWLSHMLDCQLFGLNPAGHHLTNVCLHTATAVILFLVLRRMTGALWRSGFVAAVFAIHPLRVESVAWIAERKDVLSAFFFILTLAAYVAYARRPTIPRYGTVASLFVLGLLAKPMLVTLPIVLLLLDYWPLNRIDERWTNLRRLIIEKLPLLLLSVGSVVATLIAQSQVIQPLSRIPISSRVGNAVEACVRYLCDLFWPARLAVYYPANAATAVPAEAVIAGCVVIAISVAVILLRRRRYVVTGWLWYLIMLAPVIGIVQVGSQSRADRYTYLPQIGICVLLTWGMSDLIGRRTVYKRYAAAAATLIITALIFSARQQAALWRDSETLWSHTVARTTDNPVGQVYFGEALYAAGKTADAIEHYRQAISLDPAHAPAYSALGVALLEQGQVDDSRRVLEQALQITPDYAEAHYNIGNTHLAAGNIRDSLVHYGRAIELNSGDYEAQNNLAWILATHPAPEIRNGTRAVELAEAADVSSRQSSPIVAATLGAAYAEAGRFSDAVSAAERAIRLTTVQGNPDRAESIREQLAIYESGSPFRDLRFQRGKH